MTHNWLFFTSSFSGPRMAELLVLLVEVKYLQETQQPGNSALLPLPVKRNTLLTEWMKGDQNYEYYTCCLCSAPNWPIEGSYNFISVKH